MPPCPPWYCLACLTSIVNRSFPIWVASSAGLGYRSQLWLLGGGSGCWQARTTRPCHTDALLGPYVCHSYAMHLQLPMLCQHTLPNCSDISPSPSPPCAVSWKFLTDAFRIFAGLRSQLRRSPVRILTVMVPVRYWLRSGVTLRGCS